MSQINKILVPTDFSEEASNALGVAVSIAKWSGAEITLLHVMDIPVIGQSPTYDIIGASYTSPEDPALHKNYVNKLMSITKEKINKIKEEYNYVTIKNHVVFDSFQKHIADFIIKDDTDLVVIGSKGSSGLDEVLVGSNTERVIRLSKVPVLTVKKGIENFNPRKIVFASNFKKVSEKAISTLKEFQKLFDSEIEFVKIITPNTFETTPDTELLIENFVKGHDFKDYNINVFNYFTEEEGIRVFGNSIGAGLLALTTHGRTGLAHLFLGSIAEEVANHSSLPVLTFNQHYK
ncbi:universal stress protein [Flexithrix dorotheae]|uniref:universal stress protein n=1 Tax=Flexithrix dorotheae TaxID=70993 RepID=UPI000373A631|nr:universal stress protein [Flexithrix dorotheae]